MKKYKASIFLLFVFLVLYVLIIAYASGKYSIPNTSISYTVQAGDTLWEIATDHCPTSHTGAVVSEIEKMNSLGDYIHPGQVLEIPVEEGFIDESYRCSEESRSTRAHSDSYGTQNDYGYKRN